MNNHQSLKAEIDAREENFAICVNLGKDLVMRKHSRSQEVRDRLQQLALQRGDMMEKWEETWEYLQLILEVYQFARDATVAEAWLIAHEPYLNSQEFGETLDAVETLLKKHEAFERSAATQDERFAALERLTTMEVRHRQKMQQEDYSRQHPGSQVQKQRTYADKYLEDFLPPPEPEPEPEPIPVTITETQAEIKPEKREDSGDIALQRAAAEQQPEEAKRVAEQRGQQPMSDLARSASLPKKAADEKPQPAGGAGVKRSETTPASGKSKRSAHEAPGTSGEPSSTAMEGNLNRKHEWESTTKKASNRKWEKLFAMLSGTSLLFYKDQKHARAEPKTVHRPEIDLTGASAHEATDYTKKQFVFRLKLPNGGDYLFQAKDKDELQSWIDHINQVTGGETSGQAVSRAQTMPTGTERRDEKKKGGFFTLGSKKK
jgi:spectrin beta